MRNPAHSCQLPVSLSLIHVLNRVLLCGPLRLTQFAAYIAGEVFISSHIMGCAVFLQLSRYTEDYALSLIHI